MVTYLSHQERLAQPLVSRHHDDPAPAIVQVFDAAFKGVEFDLTPDQWNGEPVGLQTVQPIGVGLGR